METSFLSRWTSARQRLQVNGRRSSLAQLACVLSVLSFVDAKAASPFRAVPSLLPEVRSGVVAVADYDNDGRLDLVISGADKPNPDQAPTASTVIWRNTGSGFVKAFDQLPQLSAGHLAWADLNNDGWVDLVVSGLNVEGEFIGEVWKNSAGQSFTRYSGLEFEVASGVIPAVGAITSGDFNNDGLTDLVLVGDFDGFQFSYLYTNTGTGFVHQDLGLEVLFSGGAAVGDFENDGRLDIVVAGVAKRSPLDVHRSQVLRNTGAGFLSAAELPPSWDGPIAVLDYNQDGKEDVLLSGSTAAPYGYKPTTRLLINKGAGFEASTESLPALASGSLQVADFNNDGLVDFLITGRGVQANAPFEAHVLMGKAGGGFALDTRLSVGFEKASAAWIDFDQDGRLDFVTTGNRFEDPTASATALWQNTEERVNTAPATPTNLSATREDDFLRLSWDAATDSETAAASLTYNVRVGTQPGAGDVVNPMASAEGTRRILAAGNARHRLMFLLKKAPQTTYYWSVQAVDGGLKGGSFAPEQRFGGAVSVPPVIRSFVLEDQGLLLSFDGTAGLKYQIEATPSIESPDPGTPTPWTSVGSALELGDAKFSFIVPRPVGSGAHFYRVIEVK